MGILDAPPIGVPFLRPSGDATGSTDTARINQSLAARPITVVHGGTFNITASAADAALVIPSNRTLVLWEAELRLVAGSNCLMLRNANHGSAQGDTDISIQGFGRASFNGQGSLQTRQSLYYNSSGLSLASITGLRVRDVQVGPTNATAILLQGITKGRFRSIHLEQDLLTPNQAGIWINMACTDIRIDGVTGKTGDDAIPISPVKNYAAGVPTPNLPYYMSNPNHSTDIHVSNVDVDAGSFLIRLLCGDGLRCQFIQFDNVRNRNANCNDPLFGIGNAGYIPSSSYPALGDIAHITLNGFMGGARFGYPVMLAFGQHCQNIKISDGQINKAWLGALIGSLDTYAPQVDHLMIDGIQEWDASSSSAVGDLVNFRAGSIVTDLQISNMQVKSCQSILNNAGTVTGLKMANVHVGKSFHAPFRSAIPETGQIDNVTVADLNGSGVTYSEAMASRLGPSMPVFAAADVTPSPVAGSHIFCVAGKDPTGGSYANAAEYVGDGSAWNRTF